MSNYDIIVSVGAHRNEKVAIEVFEEAKEIFEKKFPQLSDRVLWELIPFRKTLYKELRNSINEKRPVEREVLPLVSFERDHIRKIFYKHMSSVRRVFSIHNSPVRYQNRIYIEFESQGGGDPMSLLKKHFDNHGVDSMICPIGLDLEPFVYTVFEIPAVYETSDKLQEAIKFPKNFYNHSSIVEKYFFSYAPLDNAYNKKVIKKISPLMANFFAAFVLEGQENPSKS